MFSVQLSGQGNVWCNSGFPSKIIKMQKRQTSVFGYFWLEASRLLLWCQIMRHRSVRAGWDSALWVGARQWDPVALLGSGWPPSRGSASVRHCEAPGPPHALSSLFLDSSLSVSALSWALLFMGLLARSELTVELEPCPTLLCWERDKKGSPLFLALPVISSEYSGARVQQ